jgi:hypothetical protein
VLPTGELDQPAKKDGPMSVWYRATRITFATYSLEDLRNAQDKIGRHWTTRNMSQQARSLSSVTTFPVGAKSATNREQQGSGSLGLSCTVARAFGNLLIPVMCGKVRLLLDVGTKHQLAQQLTRAA